MSSPCLEPFFFFNKLSIVTQLLAWACELLHKHALAMSELFRTKAELEGAAEVGPECLSCSPSVLSWFTSILISLRPQTSPETFENLAGSLDSQHLLSDGNALCSAWFDCDVKPQKCVHERSRVSAVCTQVVRCHFKLHGWSKCLSAALWRAPCVGGGLIDG